MAEWLSTEQEGRGERRKAWRQLSVGGSGRLAHGPGLSGQRERRLGQGCVPTGLAKKGDVS